MGLGYGLAVGRLAAAALVLSLAWKLPYAVGVAPPKGSDIVSGRMWVLSLASLSALKGSGVAASYSWLRSSVAVAVV